jgi:hypothetical protein
VVKKMGALGSTEFCRNGHITNGTDCADCVSREKRIAFGLELVILSDEEKAIYK